jgi:hypothetical protein
MKNTIKHIIVAMALTLGFSYITNAQVTSQKIGTNPTNIAPSAVLDIESANKGVLFPRVALTAANLAGPIVSPATGLTVFNTATDGTAPNTVTPGYYYWNGTKWTKLATDAESSKWTNDAANSRVNLTNLANGTTARTGATNFAVTDGNVLQIGDMTNVSGSALPERGIMVRKNGNASITSVSDGGIYSVFENQIYGGNVSGSAAYNVFAKSRGSLASPQAVQNGDLIGIFDYRGFSGTGYGNSARIMTRVEGPVTTTSVPVSFEFHTVGPGETSPSQRLKISSNGNVGIGTSTPTSRLEVDGAATNTMAFNAFAGTTIDFSKSNLAYTTANPGAFTLSNLKNGGTYTLAVQGTTAGTAGFTATGFTFKSPNNGLTAANKETIYTFMVMGTSVYFYMTTGL